MRKLFEMTTEQENALLEACRPVPYLVFGGRAPESPQERANRAWERLGKEMGFLFMTVQPVPNKGNRFFTAEETDRLLGEKS